jgi:uroporphyrinogen-III synthase
MRPLVIIRPEPGASASVKRARALRLKAVAVPLFDVRAVDWTMPDGPIDGLVVTSANAFRHGGAGLRALNHLPVHAVGDATAAVARDAGFTVVTVGKGTAEDLAGRLPGGRLLHLAGRDHRDLPGTEAVVIYESIETGSLDARDVSDAVIAVHSPRAGQRLAALVGARGTTAIAAISEAAALACGEGWDSVDVAAMPSDEAVLALAARLCQNGGQ